MKLIGTILLVLGLIGTLYYGYQAMENSESFSVLGVDVTVSKANWTPVIISGAMLIIGLILTLRKK